MTVPLGRTPSVELLRTGAKFYTSILACQSAVPRPRSRRNAGCGASCWNPPSRKGTMSEKNWGETVLDWFVVREWPGADASLPDMPPDMAIPGADAPDAAGMTGSGAAGEAAGTAGAPASFVTAPPAAPEGKVDFPGVFSAAGVDDEEKSWVKNGFGSCIPEGRPDTGLLHSGEGPEVRRTPPCVRVSGSAITGSGQCERGAGAKPRDSRARSLETIDKPRAPRRSPGNRGSRPGNREPHAGNRPLTPLSRDGVLGIGLHFRDSIAKSRESVPKSRGSESEPGEAMTARRDPWPIPGSGSASPLRRDQLAVIRGRLPGVCDKSDAWRGQLGTSDARLIRIGKPLGGQTKPRQGRHSFSPGRGPMLLHTSSARV
jgi:hypothetical protein